MSVLWTILAIIFILNTILAIITVFRQPRDIAATWAWLLVLILMPVVGFIFYMFTGRGLSRHKIFSLQTQVEDGLAAKIHVQKQENAAQRLLPATELSNESTELVNLFLSLDKAPLTKNNHVEIITDGHQKFKMLFRDLRAAKSSIHIEYYTIYNDRIGNQLMDILKQKAAEGVEVNVIYDAWGSQGATKKWWSQLEAVGGHVEAFFSSKHSLSDFRLNYRDHRKIVVVDGEIGYVGGFNVGDQYLGRLPKFGYWRDTHLRILGEAVASLQIRFTMDWNATVGPDEKLSYSENYFPEVSNAPGNVSMQIVSSGPNTDTEQIKMGYLKMISSATKSIWIQSPYLIPDDSLIDALRVAALSGIDVRIMIPDMPDHPFIYRATQYYARLLHNSNIHIYLYRNGFLHAKTFVVDDHIASVGTANLDIRSFKLNFEVNAFIYDKDIANQLHDIFLNDLKHSTELTNEMLRKQSRWLRFKQHFSRLLSPIL
ncbi:MAG: cardiolipin synthase [Candidatus Paralactobacillus gallistercoris]|uniref:Cardiolipin synthase n=1 Tax=Candidatus Paralactobacillus gallistercoris TaxID=2838724 RepID=A0A948X0Z9_9LACO|nr:cardiolipin synthase [Candidatus Paralactobacillus gallistercoris]